jgi:hypothetical protein
VFVGHHGVSGNTHRLGESLLGQDDRVIVTAGDGPPDA